MLKKDVIKYLGFEDDRVKGDIEISELLKITQSAVIMWGDIIPRKRAEKLHTIFREGKFLGVAVGAPSYNVKFYAGIELDRQKEQELKKLNELKAKYE